MTDELKIAMNKHNPWGKLLIDPNDRCVGRAWEAGAIWMHDVRQAEIDAAYWRGREDAAAVLEKSIAVARVSTETRHELTKTTLEWEGNSPFKEYIISDQATIEGVHAHVQRILDQQLASFEPTNWGEDK